MLLEKLYIGTKKALTVKSIQSSPQNRKKWSLCLKRISSESLLHLYTVYWTVQSSRKVRSVWLLCYAEQHQSAMTAVHHRTSLTYYSTRVIAVVKYVLSMSTSRSYCLDTGRTQPRYQSVYGKSPLTFSTNQSRIYGGYTYSAGAAGCRARTTPSPQPLHVVSAMVWVEAKKMSRPKTYPPVYEWQAKGILIVPNNKYTCFV